MADRDDIPHDPLLDGELASDGVGTEVRPPSNNKSHRATGNPRGRPSLKSLLGGKGNSSNSEPRSTPEAKNTKPVNLERALFLIFKRIGKLCRSDAEFAQADFKDLSTDLLDLSRRYAFLAPIILALHPLIVVGEILEKGEQIVQGMPRRNHDDVDGQRPFVPGGGQRTAS